MLEINPAQHKSFELVLDIKGPDGKPTGRRKSFSSDRGSDIYSFWHRHQPAIVKKKKKEEVAPPTDANSAQKILSKMAEQLEKKQQDNNS